MALPQEIEEAVTDAEQHLKSGLASLQSAGGMPGNEVLVIGAQAHMLAGLLRIAIAFTRLAGEDDDDESTVIFGGPPHE